MESQERRSDCKRPKSRVKSTVEIRDDNVGDLS